MTVQRRISLFPISFLLIFGLLVALPAFSQEEDSGAGGTEQENEKKADEMAEEPATGSQVAESLRQAGQVVSQTGDLKIAVDSQVFAEFPGYDLDHLTRGQHAWLLKQANAVFCNCGCRGDTVARCVVLDPTCQTARQMLDKMLAKAGQMGEEELAAAAVAQPAAEPPGE